MDGQCIISSSEMESKEFERKSFPNLLLSFEQLCLTVGIDNVDSLFFGIDYYRNIEHQAVPFASDTTRSHLTPSLVADNNNKCTPSFCQLANKSSYRLLCLVRKLRADDWKRRNTFQRNQQEIQQKPMAKATEDFYLRYYVGHKGKFGHEFLEFEFRPDGKLRYANNSNYKNDTMIRKEAYVHHTVMEELKRIIVDSEIMAEDDSAWPPPDRVGRQVSNYSSHCSRCLVNQYGRRP